MIQILANSLIDGAYIALLAICFGLIYNTLKVFHFAFGVFLVLACYLIFQGYGYFSYLIVAFLIGLIEVYIYYPLVKKNSPPAVSLVSSLGIYIIIINLIALIWGNDTKLFSNELQPISEYFGIILTKSQLNLLFLSVFCIAIIFVGLKYYHTGEKIIAVGENPMLAKSLGINVKFVRLVVIISTTFFSSLVSVYRAWDVGIDPYIGMGATLTAAVAFIISGGKNYYYVVISGVLLGILRNLAVWYFSAQWMDAITFIVLILFLLYKNMGMFVEARRLEEVV